MRIIGVFSVILLSALVKTAGAQVTKQNNLSSQQMAVVDPSASMETLSAVIGNLGDTKGRANETGQQFGLDINKLKIAMPGVVQTETIWHLKGKNSLMGSNQESIDYGQLVPLLIGALREQNERYEFLKKEVEVLKLQLHPK